MTPGEKERWAAAVGGRLKGFGYALTPEDGFAIGFLIDKAAAYFCAACNVAEVPPGLFPAAVDRVCGEFLAEKKAAGALSPEAEERVAEAVKLGDTQVTFAKDATPSQRFDACAARLSSSGAGEIAAYRRLVW